jgi:hypothetical protein
MKIQIEFELADILLKNTASTAAAALFRRPEYSSPGAPGYVLIEEAAKKAISEIDFAPFVKAEIARLTPDVLLGACKGTKGGEMTIADFQSRLCRHLDQFLAWRKEMNQQNPIAYPLELDSFLEWQEEFILFSEDLELHPGELQPQIYPQLMNTLRCS